MTVEGNGDSTTTAGDPKTTAPDIPADEWRMPEPVFRKTSGRLPEGFAQKPQAVGEADTGPAVHAAPEPRPKSHSLKIVIVILAISAMVAFIAVFLTVVYFMFLR
jgi:hypothetical protein